MPRARNTSKKTALNAVEQYELNQWLEQNHINSHNLRRSFTDVLPLARLLARYYPDLIDLNYYPPRNSVQNKLCNWESFNKRVLTRLGLHLTREQMVRVARSVPGSVDLLLYSIMRVQLAAERKAREAKDSSELDDDEDNTNANANNNENEKDKEKEHGNDNDNDNDNDKNDNDIDNDHEFGVDHETDAERQRQRQQQQQQQQQQPLLQQQQSGARQHLVSDMNAQRPRTLKQAQAVLRRSERAQRATGVGVGVGVGIAATMQQRRSGHGNAGAANASASAIEAGAGAGTGTGTGTGAGTGAGAGTATSGQQQRGEQQLQPQPQQQHHQQQRTVLYSHYMQAVKQLQQRNAKIARFNQLSAHLENMLQLKSERIDELQQQVADAVARLNPPTSTTITTMTTTATTTPTSTLTSTSTPTPTPPFPPPPADAASQTAEANRKTHTTNTTKNKHNNNNHNHSNSNNKRRVVRPKKRGATIHTIQALTDRNPIPGFGFAGAPFPLKLTTIA